MLVYNQRLREMLDNSVVLSIISQRQLIAKEECKVDEAEHDLLKKRNPRRRDQACTLRIGQ